jgi:large subunit ribosomal protein L13
VLNAAGIVLTGNKAADKEYIRHTGYPGGQRTEVVGEVMKENPVKVVEKAIKGMLPKNKLGSKLYTNLYVYAGSEHTHEGQQPKEININDIK